MARKRVVLDIVATDRTFRLMQGRQGPVWLGKCIHCNSKLMVTPDGTPIGKATVEHIVPRTHGGTDDVRNVAMACARCNGAKGRRLDNRRRDDPDLVAMIERLQQRRADRWRDPDDAGSP